MSEGRVPHHVPAIRNHPSPAIVYTPDYIFMKNTVLTLGAIASLSLVSANAEEGKERQRPDVGEIAATMIEKHDQNGDYGLDADELKAALKARHEAMKARRGGGEGRGERKGPPKGERKGPPKGERPEGERLKNLVEKFDEDGDGVLNAKELESLLKAQHQRMRRARGEGKHRGQPKGAE